MVAGIPNSGKSSFINRMAKRQALKTEDRPGVTVNKQWVKISEEIELLDTPGILWPKLYNLIADAFYFIGVRSDRRVAGLLPPVGR